MAVVFEKPKALTDAVFHYCPGCTHGIIHRLVAEAIDTLGIEGRTIGIAPVGCSVLAYDYFTCDMVEASHGRAPAVATGVKRSLPDRTCGEMASGKHIHHPYSEMGNQRMGRDSGRFWQKIRQKDQTPQNIFLSLNPR